MSEMPLRWAWFSEKQRIISGTVFYRGLDGREIEATMVSGSINHGTNWSDIRCLGQVQGYLRRGQAGDVEELLETDPSDNLDGYRDYLNRVVNKLE